MTCNRFQEDVILRAVELMSVFVLLRYPGLGIHKGTEISALALKY